MGSISFKNASDSLINIIIEPIADRYVLPPGDCASIEYDDVEGANLEFEYYSMGEIGIWTHGETKVLVDGKLLTAR